MEQKTANEELILLMNQKELSLKDVADLTESSVDAVKAWRSPVNSTRYRAMPKSKLKLLKLGV